MRLIVLNKDPSDERDEGRNKVVKRFYGSCFFHCKLFYESVLQNPRIGISQVADIGSD